MIISNNKKTLIDQLQERENRFNQYNKNLIDKLYLDSEGLIKSEKETTDMFEGFKDDFKAPEDGDFNDFEKRTMDCLNGIGNYPTTEQTYNNKFIENDTFVENKTDNKIDNMINELVNKVGKVDNSIYQQEQIENDDIQSYYDQELSNFKEYLDNTKHKFEFF